MCVAWGEGGDQEKSSRITGRHGKKLGSLRAGGGGEGVSKKFHPSQLKCLKMTF